MLAQPPFGPPYLGVSNDLVAAPNDALTIINFINAGLGGEGERTEDQPENDHFFSELGSQYSGSTSAMNAANGLAEMFVTLTSNAAQQPKRRLYW